MKFGLDLPRDPPVIILKTENGKFLSRMTQVKNENVILAKETSQDLLVFKEEVCEKCQFSLEVFPLK